MNIFEKLLAIQQELKAPKGQYNSFGKYSYRSCEDILEAVKPICAKYNIVLTVSDELVYLGDRYYIKATARLIDIEFPVGYDVSTQTPNVSKAILDKHNSIENTAYAREEETKKGMDGSQITGTASSYARKYALNGLFCIDDTKDADTDEYKKQENKAEQKPKPEPKVNEADQKKIISLAVRYAEMRDGNADELLKYYTKKYKVVNIKDLTQSQGTEVIEELTKYIERSTKQ